jgi:DNA-binding MarR family transcriptional regulator
VSQESLEIAANLRRSLADLNRRLRFESRGLGLSTTKHSILGQLYRSGPKTPTALAHSEGVQPQTLTRVLADLEESGLVLRRQDERDRRQFQLEITAEGRELLVQDAGNRARLLASAIDGSLTNLEKDLLRLSIHLLDKLTEVPLPDRSNRTRASDDCNSYQEPLCESQ